MAYPASRRVRSPRRARLCYILALSALREGAGRGELLGLCLRDGAIGETTGRADALESLLTAVAAGDRAAFRELYRRTAPKLYAIVRALIRNKERSDEILQDAFVRIWRNAARFDPVKGSAMTWLSTLTRRLAIDDLRRRVEPVRSLDADEALQNTLAAEVPDPEPVASGRLGRCLERLRQDYRRAVLLAYIHGFTYEQLSQRLDKPVGTVKTWVHRGLANLRTCMG